MKIIKTKDGEKISFKEAIKRFKKGIEDITPLQKLENEIKGTFITLMGFAAALVATLWNMDTIGVLSYGLILIFVGNLVTTGLRFLGMKQQLRLMRNIDDEAIDITNLLDRIDEDKAKEHMEKLDKENKKEVK